MTAPAETVTCFWRDDIDSLAFQPEGHNGLCVIHQRAFRALLGFLPEPNYCCTYFENQKNVFQHAAAAKITRAVVFSENNFHLNSRDIRLALKLSQTL